MTIDRASVEEALRLWNEVYDANESCAIDLFPEIARELQRLWQVEEAARAVDAEHHDGRASFRVYKRLRAALANPAADG